MSTITLPCIVVLLLLWLWFLYLHSVCMSMRRERGSEAESGRDLAESYWWSSSSSSSSSCHFQHGLFLLIKIPVHLLCFYSMEEETNRRQSENPLSAALHGLLAHPVIEGAADDRRCLCKTSVPLPWWPWYCCRSSSTFGLPVAMETGSPFHCLLDTSLQ